MARLLSVFRNVQFTCFSEFFFSEVPLDHLIRFGVPMLPFLLFLYFWQCCCLKLLKWFAAKWINFPRLQMCFPVASKFLCSPPPHMIVCSHSSLILPGSNINADVTEFLKIQLVGINRNCKSIPLPHFAIFLTNYCPFKFCRRLGIWKEVLCLEVKTALFSPPPPFFFPVNVILQK